MSEVRNNTFSMLGDDENQSPHDTHPVSMPSETRADSASSPPKAPDSSKNDDSNWTVQQNTRSRRLAPVWNLSRHDLGAENLSRSKSSGGNDPPPQAAPGLDKPNVNPTHQAPSSYQTTKKKVQRFSKEDLLSYRKPSTVLKSMAQFTDIISVEPLEPISMKPLDVDEVHRLWNVDKQKDANRVKGKQSKRDDEGDSGKNDNDIWDDGGGTFDNITFALADMAAAALKFQSETANLSTLKDLSHFTASEDPIDKEDEDIPEWARDDLPEPIPGQENPDSQVDTELLSKRSMLLEALQIQPQPSQPITSNSEMPVENGESSEPKTSAIETSSIVNPDWADSNVTSAPSSVLTQSDEWFYTDPQGSVQGPFSSENMKAWSDAGYFTPELPIKLKFWQSFHHISIVFPVFFDAFRSQPPEPVIADTLSREQSMIDEQKLIQDQQQRILQAQAEQKRLQELAMLEQMRIQQMERMALERRQELAEENRRKELLIREQRQAQAQSMAMAQAQALAQAQAQAQAQALAQAQAHALAQAQAQALAQAQAQAAEDKRREQMYIEAEKQRYYLEARRQREGLSDEIKYHEQFAYENQRKIYEDQMLQQQALLDDQRRKVQLQQQQKRLEDQRQEEFRQYQEEQFRLQQEKLLLEQRRQREYLEEQRRNREAYENALNEQSKSSIPKQSIAPWATQMQTAADEAKQRENLLEIQRREEAESRARREHEAANREQMLKGSTWAKATTSPPSQSLLNIQLEEQRKREAEVKLDRQTVDETSETGASSTVSMSSQLKSLLGVQGKGGWSGSTNTSGMTLREIMEQEQLMQASQSDHARAPQAGSWAAKASTATPMYIQPKPVASAHVKKTEHDSKNIWLPTSKPVETHAAAKLTKPSHESSNMPKEIAEWCETQLKKINPQADAALMEICFTFESAGDVREYVSQLLGSTPQASQFATEFIRRKESFMSHNVGSQLKKKKK